MVDSPDCSVFWVSSLGIGAAGLVSKEGHKLPAILLLILSRVSTSGDQSAGKQGAEL